MRNLCACLFLLLCAAVADAQSTTVSGTVTDAGGQTWNLGTVTATFVPNKNFQPAKYSWSGGALLTSFTGALSSSGTYSISLPSNGAINPAGSKWTLKFCPLATSGCFNVNNVTVGGTTQTVNATPPAIAIDLLKTPDKQLAYATGEIVAAQIGSTFYLIGTGPQSCSAVTGNTCTSWGGGGSSTTTLAALTDVTVTSPANLDRLTYVTADGKWENTRLPYVFGGYAPGAGTGGIYLTSQVLLAVPVGVTINFPANFTGSQAVLQAATTASTVFIINKVIAGTPTQIGSITCGIAATVCTLTTVSGLTQSLVSGNVFQILAPVSADVTAAGLGFTIAGTQ
jgi:hypothetical protein